MNLSPSCSGHLYDALDVERSASMTEIRQQYRRKALEYHPDKHMGVSLEAFQEIEEAYHILIDSKTRLLYDLFGREKMKVLESNSMVEVLTQNLPYTVYSIFLLSSFVGCAFFGVILGVWRFDRQYATWNQGKPDSFSWWLPAVFLFPLVLLLSFISGVQAKATFSQGHSRTRAFCQFVWTPLPFLQLVVATMFFNGSIGRMIPFFVFFVSVALNSFQLYVTTKLGLEDASSVFEEDSVSMKAVKRRAFLHGLFVILVFVRVLQSGSGGVLSMWIIASPIFVDFLWEYWTFFSNWQLFAMKMVVVFYTLLLWVQKLNVEWNNVSGGNEPKAWVCCLPLIIFLFTVFFLLIELGLQARSFVKSAHYEA